MNNQGINMGALRSGNINGNRGIPMKADTNFPAVVSVPVFLLTAPFLMLFIPLGMRAERSRGTNQRERVRRVLLFGAIFVGIECSLLLNLPKANGQIFGWLFCWACAHVMPAYMVAHICTGLRQTLKQPLPPARPRRPRRRS